MVRATDKLIEDFTYTTLRDKISYLHITRKAQERNAKLVLYTVFSLFSNVVSLRDNLFVSHKKVPLYQFGYR